MIQTSTFKNKLKKTVKIIYDVIILSLNIVVKKNILINFDKRLLFSLHAPLIPSPPPKAILQKSFQILDKPSFPQKF